LETEKMMRFDFDSIDEFAQGWPQGTAHLLVPQQAYLSPRMRRWIAKVSSQDYVDWAVNALMAGLAAPSLNILAGLDCGEEPSIWDAREYFNRCMRELGLEIPDNVALLLRVYLLELVSQIASGEADPCEALDSIHRNIIYPLDHPRDLMPWCYLWEGNTPDGFPAEYSEDEYPEVITAYAKSWMETGPDILFSRLAEGIQVTFSPSPVKARRRGTNGQRYEWVFETMVRALDKPVAIHTFGTFSKQRGRWVFSNPTGDEFGADDFADCYSCPGAILEPGEPFSTLNTVSSRNPRGWKASWYFTGVTLLEGGNIVKGTAIVQGLAELDV
jgi:hypothetical protein